MAAPFVRQRRSDSLSMNAAPVCPNKEMGRPTCRNSALPEEYYCWVCQGIKRHAGGLPPALSPSPANPGCTVVMMGPGDRIIGPSPSSPMFPSASYGHPVRSRRAYPPLPLDLIGE